MEPESEEDKDTIKYLKPNIETELSVEKKTICRDMIQEIKNFGVNQRQVLFLIQLLALELENREAMTQVISAIGTVRELVPNVSIDESPKKNILFIPKGE